MAFTYYRALTIDHTKVPNTNQTNFPVLVSLTHSTLATVSNGGHVQNSNGYDINFFSDAALTTKLSWEVTSYNVLTGVLVAWVKVPTVATATDTVIYMAYGDASISTFQGSVTGVWDSNFKGVWHFGDGTTLSVADSTSNANNGTNHSGTAAAGLFGGALALSGSSQYVDIGATSSLIINGAITISAWVKPTDRANYNGIIAKSHASSGGIPAAYDLFITQSSGIPSMLQGNGVSAGFNLDFDEMDGVTAIPNGSWSYIVATIASGVSGAAGVMYLNGVSNATHSMFRTNAAGDLGDRVYIGSRSDFVTMFKGSMQEVRISNAVRSADWIKTEYNNQSSPGNIGSAGFITYGNETVTTSKTTTGKGRITVATTKTNTGKGRIGLVTTKTNTGKSRLTAVTLKVIQAISRITAATLKALTGKGRVQKATTLTETGVSRITAATPKTTTGKGRVTAAATKTQTGKTRVTAATTKTTTGVARIASASSSTTTKTQTGRASIQGGNNSGFFFFIN